LYWGSLIFQCHATQNTTDHAMVIVVVSYPEAMSLGTP
jgi:hypothetical protein